MSHPVRPFILLVCAGLLVAACKKDTADPQAVPVPSGAAPETQASPTTTAEAQVVSATASAAPTPPPPPVVQQQPIDGCCAALSSAGNATKSQGDKEKF